jgi:hypothetical protein
VWCLKRGMLGDDTDDSGDTELHEAQRAAVQT